MKRDNEIKMNLLGMLQDLMKETHGNKMKPKEVSVEIVQGKPESMKEVLEEAREKKPVEEMMGDVDGDGDHDIHDHALEKEAEMYEDAKEGEMEDDEKDEKYCEGGKVSLQDYFKKMRRG